MRRLHPLLFPVLLAALGLAGAASAAGRQGRERDFDAGDRRASAKAGDRYRPGRDRFANRSAKVERPGLLDTVERPAAVPRFELPAEHPFKVLSAQTAESPMGAIYRADSAGQLGAAVVAHGADQPEHAGSFGVFDDPPSIFGLVDEALERHDAALHRTKYDDHSWAETDVQGDADEKGEHLLIVNMKRPIGYVGGAEGAAEGHPAASHLQISLRGREVLDAEPVYKQTAAAPAPRQTDLALPKALAALGLPTDAQHSLSSPNDYLMVNADSRSVVSYNRDTMNPNWVFGTLEAKDMGEAGRRTFMTDDALPDAWPHPLPNALSGTPFDRGHLLPRSHRTATQSEADATFRVGTNMVPQIQESNEGPWNAAELEERRLVNDEGKRVAFLVGPIYEGTPSRIGGIAVPSKLFRLTWVMDAKRSWDELPQAAVRAMILPNLPRQVRINEGWQKYQVDPQQILTQAELTGFSPLVRAALSDPASLDRSETPHLLGEHVDSYRPRRFVPGKELWRPTQVAQGASSDQREHPLQRLPQFAAVRPARLGQVGLAAP